MNNDFYMMWLTDIDGMTLKKAYLLLSHFGKPEEIWNSDKKLLCSISGISEAFADKIISSKDPEALDNKISRLEELGIRYISINNPDYPEECYFDPEKNTWFIPENWEPNDIGSYK